MFSATRGADVVQVSGVRRNVSGCETDRQRGRNNFIRKDNVVETRGGILESKVGWIFRSES